MAGQLVLLVVAVVFTTAAADTNARFDKLGHQIMCSCGCNELLLECNHVGCPNSDGMRQELMAGVDRGDSDKIIFAAFVRNMARPRWLRRRLWALTSSAG